MKLSTITNARAKLSPNEQLALDVAVTAIRAVMAWRAENERRQVDSQTLDDIQWEAGRVDRMARLGTVTAALHLALDQIEDEP